MNEPNDTPRSGLILLSQPEQIGISPRDMTGALPDAYKLLPRLDVELDMAEIARQAVHSRDWGKAQRTLEELFRTKLAPLREKHPDYRLVYFGSSPVPLALYLGFLLYTWQQVEVIPHHHARRAWGWFPEPGRAPARLARVQLPDYRDQSSGVAVIRVSTSHRVDPHMTQRVVSNPLLELDIALESPAEDAFTRQEEMQEVARAFREALNVIGTRFPGIQRVHLFASVQPGMALLLGAQINKTMHPPVQTYQYARHVENEPYHLRALLVNAPSHLEPLPLTEEEQSRADGDRGNLLEDLEQMKELARREQENPGRSWIAGLLPGTEALLEFSAHWLHLSALYETPLSETTVEVGLRAVEDSFRLDSSSNAWQIDAHWLARLARRIPEAARRRRALRMLVFHELAHRGPQALTSWSSKEIGRFPKVLEEIDYHADVWAMLHEYALTKTRAPDEVADPRKFFVDLVRIATETMWAFDDDGPPLQEIQTRRLNRYLIWYWQYLLLERGAGRGQKTTLESILARLAQRPLIELAGPTVIAHDERVFFALDTARVNVPELGVYHEGRLHRHGTRPDFNINALLERVRARDGKGILEVLRSAFTLTLH
ncbi:SAVED domain-containing protein [Archangium violaceum]|uniref:SAVED domain-containing protein n=1 Tax=Archangium violaceum TaxID=83451 RepID=UPI00193C3CC9|nr:SAVED domain-containing protein [Archangium violaceum]QRK06579.1 SAVED domain-containing protein [Archangium violaceum]